MWALAIIAHRGGFRAIKRVLVFYVTRFINVKVGDLVMTQVTAENSSLLAS
jgi:hypothetical protein